jgi:uncharacterized damage-inducible protein DinB
MDDIQGAFIAKSRSLLSGEYLPKIQHALAAVSDEQIWWRSGPETNSIGNLMLHLAGNARQWIVAGVGGAPDHRERQTEFDAREGIGRDELLARLTQTVQDVDAVLAGVAGSELLGIRTIQGTQTSVLDAVYHVVEHFGMHTGQIIFLAKMLGKKDLGFYDFPNGAPRTHWA